MARLLAAAAGLLALLLLAPLADAAKKNKDRDADAEKSEIGQKIDEERRNLEKIRAEIDAKKRRAQEAEKKKDTVLQGLQALDDTLRQRHQEQRDLERQLAQKDQELDEINAEALILGVRVAERRASILQRVRRQYMEGRFGYLKALMSADNYEGLQRRFEYLSAVSKREYDLLSAYRNDLQRMKDVERQASAARAQIVEFKAQTDRKLAEIQVLKKQKKALLARLTEQKESNERAAAELEKSAERVDTVLKDLEQRRRAAAARPKKEVAAFKPYRSLQLQWPADGDVVSFFGRQKHPSFETYVQRKGIEIRAEEGSPIRAVMAGTVAYADWLKGYGLVMILDHANGYFSLYAHASRLLAKVGQKVPAGALIGETGDTGMTGESTLYFELREGAEPVDPMLHLPKRK